MIDQNVRRMGIGGSEISALFGQNEFTSAFAVWASKKGEMVEEEPTEPQMLGTVLEPAVLELYSRLTGYEVARPQTSFQHPTRPYMIYSPDGLCIGQKRGVDAKVAFFEPRRRWGWEPNEIPARIQFQCWWYASAYDYPVWDVAALLGDGLPRIYTVTRLDPAHERTMLERAEEWWQRYIVGDERPPLDDSDEAARWLQKTYPVHRPGSIREASTEEAQLLRHYVVVRIALQKLNATRDAQEIALKEAIGNDEGLRWGDDHLFTWKKARDSKGTDWESMAIALLHNFVKDETERLALYDRYATTKANGRRIHINHPSLKKDDGAAKQRAA
jgi:predicted phage-related endonuclease